MDGESLEKEDEPIVSDNNNNFYYRTNFSPAHHVQSDRLPVNRNHPSPLLHTHFTLLSTPPLNHKFEPPRTGIKRGGEQGGLLPLLSVHRLVESVRVIAGESAHDDEDEEETGEQGAPRRRRQHSQRRKYHRH